MPIHDEFNQAHVQNPMALKMALGLSSKREGIKLDLRRGQRSQGTNHLLGMAIFATPIPPQVILTPVVAPKV
jgi:hypothetical protein